jgi:diguanylate cyclase (GGDEF)-like protein/PAS domain S-box-containing protein
MRSDKVVVDELPSNQLLSSSSPEEIERVCMRNLLASPEERIFFKDCASQFLLVSEGFLTALAKGRSLEAVIGKTDFDLFSKPHAVAAFEDEQRVIATGQPLVAKLERETFHDRADAWVSTTKVPLRDDQGEIIGTWGIARDVTAQIDAEQALVHQALHDAVTGLPNRVALMDRLQQALVALERRPGRVGLVFIDLDDFKDVNDVLGHDIGDRVLVEVARRLTDVSRRVDTVARLGGDEFVLLLSYLHDDADVRIVCDRVVSAIRAPVVVEGSDITVTGSLGVVVTSDPLIDPGELVRQADVAMYGAKRSGRNCFEIFDDAVHVQATSQAGLAVELVGAIERSELFVLYQPLFRLEDGSLSGAEALVRWRHPERGVIPPVDFIPLAEERGLIGQIDSFVLDEACRQLAAWGSEGGTWDDFVISVNVSGRQLRDRGLVDRVAAALERHGIAPSRLCLEITETALIGELGDANRVLESISNLGVRIALDDFGTGYSTLAHLQRLRADILKIDRSFIAQLGRGTRDREIIAAVTAMAHALGMTVVGEGIETDNQLDNLVAMDCDEGQGYVFAPPVAPAEIAALHGAAGRGQAKTAAARKKRATTATKPVKAKPETAKPKAGGDRASAPAARLGAGSSRTARSRRP